MKHTAQTSQASQASHAPMDQVANQGQEILPQHRPIEFPAVQFHFQHGFMAQHVLHWAAQIRAPQRHKIQRLHVSLHLVRPMHCFHVVAGFAHLNINKTSKVSLDHTRHCLQTDHTKKIHVRIIFNSFHEHVFSYYDRYRKLHNEYNRSGSPFPNQCRRCGSPRLAGTTPPPHRPWATCHCPTP